LITLKKLSEIDEENDPTGKNRRQRGREFEKTLNEMLKSEEMDPRTSFRPDGEEIDGSFILGERYYLIEAKWHKDPMPASSLYAFRGKVDGKMVGTLGVFFSMSGYSADAVDALIAGKTPNLILFDSKDLYLIEEGRITMRDAMRAKLRHCAELGQPMFSLAAYLASGDYRQRRFADADMQSTGSSSFNIEMDNKSAPVFNGVGDAYSSSIDGVMEKSQSWIFIAQSEEDAIGVKELLARYKFSAKVDVYSAGGLLAISSLIKTLSKDNSACFAAFVFEGTSEEDLSDIRSANREGTIDLIEIPFGSIEDWLGDAVSVEIFNSNFHVNNSRKLIKRHARSANLEDLQKKSPSFLSLLEKIGAKPKIQ